MTRNQWKARNGTLFGWLRSIMTSRIAICSSTGGVMFEGKSALAETRDHRRGDGEEECPATVRSADSGLFPSVKPKGQRMMLNTTGSEQAA